MTERDPQLRRRISDALDRVGGLAADKALSSALLEDADARAYADDVTRIEAALREWPAPERTEGEWEGLALRVEQRLDESLSALVDPTRPPVFDDAFAKEPSGAKMEQLEKKQADAFSLDKLGELDAAKDPDVDLISVRPGPPTPPGGSTPAKRPGKPPPAPSKAKPLPKGVERAEIVLPRAKPTSPAPPDPFLDVPRLAPAAPERKPRTAVWFGGLAMAAAVLFAGTWVFTRGSLGSPDPQAAEVAVGAAAPPTSVDDAPAPSQAPMAEPAPGIPVTPAAPVVAVAAPAEAVAQQTSAEATPRLAPGALRAPERAPTGDAREEGRAARPARGNARPALEAPAAAPPPPAARPAPSPAGGGASPLDRVLPRAPAAAAPAAPAGDPPGRDEVRASLEAVRGDVESCAEGQHGLAQIRVTIAPSGRVSGAVTQGQFAGTPQGSCMARAARGASFPAFAGEPLVVTYPFQL